MSEKRLANLLRACRTDITYCLVELDTGPFECKAAKFEDAADVSLEIFHDVLVPDSQYPPGEHRVPVLHEREIGPVVAGNICNAVSELLSARKQLLQVAKAARHRLTPHINDFCVRQHKMNKTDVAEVVRHLVDEECVMLSVRPRVHHVELAQRAEIFRGEI